MNMFLVLLLSLATLIVLLSVFFMVKIVKKRTFVKRQGGHRPLRRFRQQFIPGITPSILRASRPRRVVHPPVIQVLPHAIASSSTPEEQPAAQQRAASQTTVSAFPLDHTLKIPSCPHCSKVTSMHDIFCGACGRRLHGSVQPHE